MEQVDQCARSLGGSPKAGARAGLLRWTEAQGASQDIDGGLQVLFPEGDAVEATDRVFGRDRAPFPRSDGGGTRVGDQL